MDSTGMATTCPKCGATAGTSAEECPQCGILFSKWQQRESNVASGDTARYAAIANATSSEFNWTILIIVATVVAAIFYFLNLDAPQ
ncbi:MAG: hypothetical protein A2992_05665 [Elusimicrobia bacterium RIFCSPLOWO2_01_FULL_59_12]|nr:MAG: hypothetical protein A2992_05665 [Elusimicrobia bacterium RIFCSPLOWO2_01_FULL_59_12]